jgi:hypothetical protein
LFGKFGKGMVKLEVDEKDKNVLCASWGRKAEASNICFNAEDFCAGSAFVCQYNSSG